MPSWMCLWGESKVLQRPYCWQSSELNVKSEARSEPKVLGLFSVFQAFLLALKDTHSRELQSSRSSVCVSQVEQWGLLMLQEFLPKAPALLRFCMTLGRFPLCTQ